MNLLKRRNKRCICLLDRVDRRCDRSWFWDRIGCTRPQGLLENRLFYEVLDKVINVVRSIPFIILLSLLALTTRF